MTSDDVTAAREAFWQAVAARHPEITTGDLAPEASAAFDIACEKVVTAWLLANKACEDCNAEAGEPCRPDCLS